MRLRFGRSVRDDVTGECVQVLELRFEPAHWNAFATLMRNAFDADGRFIQEKAARILVEAMQAALGGDGIVAPAVKADVEHVSNRDFAELWNKTRR